MKAYINYKTTLAIFFTLCIGAITLSACSRSNTQSNKYESEYKELDFGVISETKFIAIGKPTRKSSARGAAATGAILGFIIGSRNNDVLGAVAGGLAGASIGSLIDNNTIDYNYSTNNVNGQELLITLENGKKILVLQRFQPGSSPFIPGDKIRIEQDIKRGTVLITKVN
ncbi:MAG: hypothetical protein QM538_06845 [Methylacidiphilales bacterium]|nr:hypothetical protein [Candidatus Methylacidiphilales bacterium]